MQDSDAANSSDTKALTIKIQQLEEEMKRAKNRKNQHHYSFIVSQTFLLVGLTSLAASILFTSTGVALIGLSLTFWGALLLYIRPQKYVRMSLLNSSLISLLTTVDQMIVSYTQEKAIHLPPRDPIELKGGRLFIPIRKRKNLLSINQEKLEKNNVQDLRKEGVYVAPTGIGLVNLFESELGTDFSRVDLNFLINKLPRLFVEDLEMSEALEITTENNTVKVKITGLIYQNLCADAKHLSTICNSIGCPLCSSIACALARATGKPVIIDKNRQSTDSKTIEICYNIVRE